MSVLDRASLEESPLADLHAIASELAIDGYRRLRREQLIDAILDRQDGEEPRDAQEAQDGEEPEQSDADEEPERPRRRGRRGGRTQSAAEEPAEESPADEEADVAEGEVELLANGSAFLRVNPPEPSDDDIFISPAQVRRCELISGDRIAGPKRPARRSERYASLYRVDTINGRPAAELADRPHFQELPVAFPDERIELGSADPTLAAIDRLTPIGKGSRVTIVGPALAGKSEALRRIADALAGREDLRLFVALAGVRPEEIAEWSAGPTAPAQTASFAQPGEVQEQAVYSVIDQARRIAVRGADAVVLIDTLQCLRVHTARGALGAARNLRDGASVTVIATAAEPIGGETTLITLDRALTAIGSFPALDLRASGTIRPELLVGDEGAAAIREAVAQ